MATGMEHVLGKGNRVAVRTNWHWDSSSPNGGYFIETIGDILDVGEVGIVLRDENEDFFAFPYAGITQILLIKKA